MKPGENTNRGRGIIVTRDLRQIKETISRNSYTKLGSKHIWIVQEYMRNPFLIRKRKFDMRCYILMTSISGIFIDIFIMMDSFKINY